jgi:UPF0271 protein
MRLENGAVVDASALIGGMALSGEIPLFVSPLVEKEVEGVEGVGLLKAARLEVRVPSRGSLDKVREGAKETGDDARLSEADMEILALALDLGLPIITDDYSIQNLAEHMGIEYVSMGERGITRKVHWTYRCKGCGKFFDERTEICPVCGSAVRSARR